ncbi:MAG: hypothetical protein HYZ34_04915 [Ignavibacteriae bacterium]|nr:hypothetical protein [Ignavibacteriota bacterium]
MSFSSFLLQLETGYFLGRVVSFFLLLYFFSASFLCAQNDRLLLQSNPGWNLLSIPLSLSDPRTTNIFPTASSKAFRYLGSYVPQDSLNHGLGYWIKFDSVEQFILRGSLRNADTIVLRKGWNMIGSVALPIPTSKITTSPANILASTYYMFDVDSGYKAVDTLLPGIAYWVKSTQQGSMRQYCWVPTTQILLSPADAFTTLTPPLLRWRASRCQAEYRLQIALEPGFSTFTLDTLVQDTTYQLPSLCDTSQYYWRVGIASTNNETVWSVSRSYQWAYPTQGLVEPPDGADVTIAPLLQWRWFGSETISYRLQIAKDSQLSMLLIDSLLTDTLFQVDTLSIATDYFWRITILDSGCNGNGNPVWSAVRRFHTSAWEYLGLETESVNMAVFDWANPNIIYAVSSSDFSGGTVGGIFKSTDRGTSWDTLIRGVTGLDIDIDPFNSSIVYFTLGINFLTQAGILKTTDGGMTWTAADSGIRINFEEGPIEFTIDPQNSNILYVGTGGPFGGTIYKSTNGGMYWFTIAPDSIGELYSGIGSIVIHPENTNIIYAVVYSFALLYRTTDGGITWQRLSVPSRVTDVKFNLRAPDSIYVATHQGMMLSTNGGVSWGFINAGLPDILLLYSGPIIHFVDTLYSTELVITLYLPGYVEEAYRSRNGGLSWERMLLPTIPVAGYFLRSPNDSTIYACVRRGFHKYIR